jgi:hypothetical protein
MSKKPKSGTVGAALETTIIFPPKTLVEELAKAKRDTKKRTQSANGTLGEKIGAAVEDKHLDRKAFSIACQLDALDDERLHITYHSLLKYCEDLGVTKRATAQEELFDGTGADTEPEAKIVDKKGAAKADGEAALSKVGRGRKVAESAGTDDKGGDDFKPLH